jgi:peptidyl-prolyl cis-trans isomerase SurA
VAANTRVALRQISAPAARQSALERLTRRNGGCESLTRDVAAIQGAELVDLGDVTESELSETVRTRIANVQPGGLTSVEVEGDLASAYVVCSRTTGGVGVPSRADLESQIYDRELALLAERYLRNLRREATIITR